MTTAYQRATSAYRSVQVTTASPTQIVCLLYDGATRFLREARAAHERGDRAGFGEKISRAHAILELLATTLDSSHDPTLAARLASLYGYCMRRLVDGNIARDPSALEEVERLLAPLRDAWAAIQVDGDPP